MAWQDVANQRLGSQAPGVIAQLNQANPNFDWSSAINQMADWNTGQYGMSWQDPNRGSGPMIAAQIVQAGGPSAQSATPWQSLAQQGTARDAQILKQQNPPKKGGLFGGGLGSVLGLAGLAMGGAGLLGGLGSLGAGAADLGMSLPGLEGMGTLGVGADLGGAGALTGGAMDLGSAGQFFDSFGSGFDPNAGMTLDPTIGRYVDPFGNVVDQSPMPGTSPNYTPSTGVTSGYSGSNFPSTLQQYFQNLPSGLQNLVKGLLPGMNGSGTGTGNGSGTGTGNYSFPFANVLGGVLDAYGTNKYRQDLLGVMNKSLDYADPFHNQRPQYQDQYRQLTSNPSNFFEDPAIKTAIGLQQDATARKLASQGYNMSGNYGIDVNKAGMAEAFKNYLPYTSEIGTAAGAHFAPGSTSAATSVGTQAAGAGQQTLAGLGAATQSALTGNQPSYLDQLFGAQKNQNLSQLLFSGLS